MAEHGNSEAFALLGARIDAALQCDQHLAELSDGPLSADDLRSHVARLGNVLHARVASGDTVAISCTSDRRVFAAVTTCLRLGYPVLICDPHATTDEAVSLLRHCKAAALITDDSTNAFANQLPGLTIVDAADTQASDAAANLPKPTPSSTALLVATSGTTDRPKVVALSHANLLAQFQIFADVYAFDANTRVLNLLPIHHVDGLIRGPLLSLWFGATLIRPRLFSAQACPEIFDDIARHTVTHLITVPSMLRILHRAFDPAQIQLPSTMRFVLCSADHLETNLWHRVERDFKVPVVNAYGLSEVVCDALIAGPDDESRIVGSIGVTRGLDAKVIDPGGNDCPDGQTGELVIIGGTVMQGYVADPEATAEVLQDNAFRTGDLVQRRADGSFFYMGRLKNVVVVGGVTIHPEAVTEVLSGLPGIAEACAFGHQTDTGEELIAAVCPLTGAALELDAVYAACRQKLSPERQPSRLVILPQLPRREAGKVDQTAIAAAVVPQTAGQSVEEIAAVCFGVSVDSLTEASSPFDTPGWDSLAHMNFIDMLEETFSFTMTPGDVASLMSISDAIEIVRQAGD